MQVAHSIRQGLHSATYRSCAHWLASSGRSRRLCWINNAAVAQTAITEAQPNSNRKQVLLDSKTAPGIVEQLDCILFDCDGVLWTGSTQIKGAAQTINALRQQGKRVLFVTNNASKSRKGYVAKFKSLGLEVDSDEIISASYAAAAYLKSVGFHETGKKALLLGYTGVEEELDEAGIPWLGGTEWQTPVLSGTDDVAALTIDADIGAVVCSWDPNFNYTRLVYAASALRELPGCMFVVTNPDDADNVGAPVNQPYAGAPLPTPSQPHTTTHPGPAPVALDSSHQLPVVTRRMQPGTGCMMAALTAGSGQQPIVVGKGGPWLVPFLLKAFNLQPNRTAIVGDRLDTDVQLGIAGGLVTMLPLTGVTTIEQALSATPQQAPDYILPSVAALAGFE